MSISHLADPGDGLGLGVLALILHGAGLLAGLRADQLRQLEAVRSKERRSEEE